MFKIGDMAVYPTQGVGVIENIESREFSGHEQKFYVLRIVDSDMRIMVPTGNVSNVGMRRLIDQKHITSVFDALAEPNESGKIASWSRRQREYNDKLKTGDLLEVADVLRELYQISSAKELSYGEKKVLEQARKLLVTEVALAEGEKEDQITKRLENIFH
ncbi:transcriptional regulator, CarD family [Malonomonas rubra DSM 5091]|uniref:Transcriptional regulator, CarD family n=1 Tax=Malonomonas rubra DSM 5091 TaxID=1122189 RepID=A0A1M6MQU8_MALRU|nr:CarD family transcriptional regulator [Malonomonas rubra]SHJ85822.1 transcriptional regulator, CarD family [Malonomonas rubra DSM 5091]